MPQDRRQVSETYVRHSLRCYFVYWSLAVTNLKAHMCRMRYLCIGNGRHRSREIFQVRGFVVGVPRRFLVIL